MTWDRSKTFSRQCTFDQHGREGRHAGAHIRRARCLSLLALVAVALLPWRHAAAADEPSWQWPSHELMVRLEVQPGGDIDASLAPPAAAGERPLARFTPLFAADAAPPAAPDEPPVVAAEPTRYWMTLSPLPSPVSEGVPVGAKSPWDTAHGFVDGAEADTYGDLPPTVALDDSTVRIGMVEPDIEYVDQERLAAEQRRVGHAAAADCEEPETGVLICGDWNRHWPHGDKFAWHLAPSFSGLAEARNAVGGLDATTPGPVTIAHLDTGYNPRQRSGLPPHFDAAHSYDFTKPENGSEPTSGGEDLCDEAFPFPNCGHGTGTLGILAGGRIQAVGKSLPPFDDFLGGAPQERVVEYRISPTVANLSAKRMARAIDYASRHDVDVISMSMGGIPSGALETAVNDAYTRGTALFTAAGNYFATPFGLRTPHGMVYPAYYNRVVGVTGVTADWNSYGLAAGYCSLLRGRWADWFMRGSYGPPWVMSEAIAGFTPNMPWMRFSKDGSGSIVDVDGGGTSAATPQVAATAALWLHKHHNELASDWRSWRKVEAVYRVVLQTKSASPHGWPYDRIYFGTGVINAPAAVREPVPHDLAPRAEAKNNFGVLAFILSGALPVADGQQATRDVHNEMVALEIAQLTATSKELQEALGDHDPATLQDDEQLKERFRAALLRDPRASDYLRSAITTPE